MKLTDILPLEKWVALEKEIHKRTGLSANVFDTEGVRISDFLEWPNRLCPAVKANDKGQSFICAVAHMNLAIEARQSQEPVIEECDGGLLKLVVPVRVGDEFLGAVGACGLLLDDGEVDLFLVNKITGIDEHELEKLSQGIAHITRQEAEALAAFITEEIQKIVDSYQKTRDR